MGGACGVWYGVWYGMERGVTAARAHFSRPREHFQTERLPCGG